MLFAISTKYLRVISYLIVNDQSSNTFDSTVKSFLEGLIIQVIPDERTATHRLLRKFNIT